ncbi:DUF5677 domain-containing protein [Neobacillus muris]|uniref:DUF5677 domain-containing protein n=1 Tax=Neobacillus muris TaxID=2941334 RepID=UPI002041C235|nr:DUF5677 domain-containing protein [Neobacillus muris]
MDKKAIGKTISELLNNAEYRIQIIKELNELYESIINDLNYNDMAKERVLKVFLLSSFNSFNSFITLANEKNYPDAILLSRKIIEILIRQEYLIITDTFSNYLREKSQEQAKILNSLINSHSIKYVSQTALWKMRKEIIKDCESLYEDKKKGTFKETPSVEKIAEKSNLLALYKKHYGTYSKFVHINMSIENYFLYNIGDKLQYIKPEEELDLHIDMIRSILNDTIYCYYLILKKYCHQLDVGKERIKEFEKNYFVFASFDLVTGQSRSNVDIAYNILKNLTGIEDINKEEEDLKEEVIFVENDVNILKREWTDLKKNVREKELELEGLDR